MKMVIKAQYFLEEKEKNALKVSISPMTWKDLAKALDVHPTFLCGVVNGDRPITKNMREAIDKIVADNSPWKKIWEEG